LKAKNEEVRRRKEQNEMTKGDGDPYTCA